ncbi:low temperature requirement protein A [Plantactinospora sp. KBS50]|uniref:low temperature requirement protein A n=1 Tax=Plantactinospora sp. KBS50 TaxID=2024580 RepID=UPI000BAAB211|nr:low temperature requirement protein A [Plantactinospora sp. KBS50]ASW55193.1 hypothetical protein CIK06_14945 [Plantactinospora sp. KBS50]
MSQADRPNRLLRPQAGATPVTTFELFFDLVYVLAVTQITDLLLGHLTGAGAVQALILLLAVWWAWMDTAWVTNWFDPDRPPVRLMLIGVMLLSLFMSAVLPEAYGGQGLAFAGAYAALQVGRTASVWAALTGQPRLRRNFLRLLAWRSATGVLWLAGGLAGGTARMAFWAAAVVVDYVAAAAGFYLPTLGRSGPADWPISGRHLAERCRLFLLIALGESILVAGTNLGRRDPDALSGVAFAVAFAGSVALWWIYFDRAAEAAAAVLDAGEEPGRLGRSAYTYHHVPMVAGIIVTAVGDELTIDHPLDPAGAAAVATVLGGPALFLLGHVLFKRAVFGRYPAGRLVAAAALVVVGVALLALPAGAAPPLLALSGYALAALAAAVVLDTRSRTAPAGRSQPAR